MTLEILLVATFYATCAALTLDSVVTASAASEVASSVAVPLRCTSENEVCLPANYSRFQLPNKGMQTKVSIGKLIFFLKYLCIVYLLVWHPIIYFNFIEGRSCPSRHKQRFCINSKKYAYLEHFLELFH